MKPPRVVLDTNVIVSAALKPDGLEARIVELVAARHLALSVSAAIMTEYRGVLARPKFIHIARSRIARLLDLVQDEAELALPSRRVTASPHEADNRFLECAAAAKAHYLVTGDTKHFPSRYRGTMIVTARELFERLEE